MRRSSGKTLERHLNAVSNKDIQTLGSTLHPDGKMMLILPGSETTYTVDEFLSFHTEWFADPTWTFDTQVLETEIGSILGYGYCGGFVPRAREGRPTLLQPDDGKLHPKEDRWGMVFH